MSETGFSSPRPSQIRRLGHVLYAAGLRMQQAMAAYVAAGDRPDQILVLEHNPVFTLGRNATRQDIHVATRSSRSAEWRSIETDRGGQVTYHGPGQIVVYPICNLKGGREDVGRLVRGLEEAMIRTAADFGVTAERLQGFPGIWVETPRGLEKLGALGPAPEPLDHHPRHRLQRRPGPGPLPLDHPLRHHRQGRVLPPVPAGRRRPHLGPGRGPAPGAHGRAAGAGAGTGQARPAAASPPSPGGPARNGPELLVMLRTPDHGLWWSSVTGMLEPGETPEAAAHRELLEEAGTDRDPDPPGLHPHASGWTRGSWGCPPGEPRFNTEVCFHLEVAAEARVDLALDEHSEYRWCGFEEARELMMWEGSKAALDLLGRKLCQPARLNLFPRCPLRSPKGLGPPQDWSFQRMMNFFLSPSCEAFMLFPRSATALLRPAGRPI